MAVRHHRGGAAGRAVGGDRKATQWQADRMVVGIHLDVDACLRGSRPLYDDMRPLCHCDEECKGEVSMNEIKKSDRRRLSHRMEVLKRQTCEQLAADVAEISRENMEETNGEDDIERAEIERQREVSIAESEIDCLRLADIDRAENLLAVGSYGRCINCQRAIPRDRLFVKPEALRCVECQALYEASLRR